MKQRRIFFLSFFVLLALATASPAAENDPLLKQGEEHLEAWQVRQAGEIAAKILSANPKSAAALDLDARVKFYEGRYEEAQQIFERALAIDAKDERRQAFRLLSQQSNDVIKALKRYESAHFILYLDEKRDGILVPYVLDALERSYEAIGAELGYYPKEKVRVEIAPDSTTFNAISTLSLRDIEETGAVGICKFNKLMTISPRALVHGYRWLDSVSHEYLHFVIVALTNNKAPIWLHEGMARFYETRWRKPTPSKDAAEDYLTPANQTLLAQALEKNRFVGFKNMEPSLIHLDTPEEVQLAYAEAASAIDFINQDKGGLGIRDLLSAVSEKPTPEAIAQVVGVKFDAFEARWKEFLKGKGLKEIEGSRVRRLKVKTDQTQDDEAVDLKEIHSVVARNRTYLGDQMLGRGRTVAAANEYRRALQVSPHSPIILTKLGRVFIQMKRFDEALSPLKKALELDPDNAGSYVHLGRVYHATKHYDNAREALEESIQINPFNPMIYRLLADAYAALGEQEKGKHAKATLEKLMTLY